MDYLDESQVEHVVTKLGRATNSGRLTWKGYENSAFRFFCDLPGFRYIVESVNSDDLAPYLLTISRGPHGRSTVLQKIEDDSNDAGHAGHLAKLYRLVKRQVMDFDGVAKEILDTLDQLNLS